MIDSGLGNVQAIDRMLRHLRIPVRIVSAPDGLIGARGLILPGVGAFDHGMDRLHRSGFRPHLDEAVLGRRLPVLGICLGMQLMGRRSDEGTAAGLGWIPAETRSFDAAAVATAGLRLPHQGWNDVMATASARLFAGTVSPRFYFSHGFHVVVDDPGIVAARAVHGQAITAAIEQDQLYGVQFHPEKSHRFGMDVLRRFAEIAGCPARA